MPRRRLPVQRPAPVTPEPPAPPPAPPPPRQPSLSDLEDPSILAELAPDLVGAAVEASSALPPRTKAVTLPPPPPQGSYPIFVELISGKVLTFEFPNVSVRYAAAQTLGRRLAVRSAPAIIRSRGRTYVVANIAYFWYEPVPGEREISL